MWAAVPEVKGDRARSHTHQIKLQSAATAHRKTFLALRIELISEIHGPKV